MKSNKPTRKHSSALVNQLLAETSPVEKAQISNRMTLATRLDDLIQAKGWNKSEFASKVGKSPSEITKWLSGTQNFTIDTLTEIAVALKISIVELFAAPQPQIVDNRHFVIMSDATELWTTIEPPAKMPIANQSGLLVGSHSTARLSLSSHNHAQS